MDIHSSPPSRVLADELGVSRGVVMEAYSQLVAEGYLVARAGGGTHIARGSRSGHARRQLPRRSRKPRAISCAVASRTSPSLLGERGSKRSRRRFESCRTPRSATARDSVCAGCGSRSATTWGGCGPSCRIQNGWRSRPAPATGWRSCGIRSADAGADGWRLKIRRGRRFRPRSRRPDWTLTPSRWTNRGSTSRSSTPRALTRLCFLRPTSTRRAWS